MDWKITSTDNVRALILIAHPDDETIFCGGNCCSQNSLSVEKSH